MNLLEFHDKLSSTNKSNTIIGNREQNGMLFNLLNPYYTIQDIDQIDLCTRKGHIVTFKSAQKAVFAEETFSGKKVPSMMGINQGYSIKATREEKSLAIKFLEL